MILPSACALLLCLAVARGQIPNCDNAGEEVRDGACVSCEAGQQRSEPLSHATCELCTQESDCHPGATYLSGVCNATSNPVCAQCDNQNCETYRKLVGECTPGINGNNLRCVEWGGECTNGNLEPIDQRSRDDQCYSCNSGFGLVNKTCVPCPAGHFSPDDGVVCFAYSGACSHGALVAQADRTQQDHCGTCDAGYKLVDKKCVAYAGSCVNGNLVSPIASRTRDDQCGSCDAGFKLVDERCKVCGTNEFQRQHSFEGASCTACDFDICGPGERLTGRCGIDQFTKETPNLKCVPCMRDTYTGSNNHSKRDCDDCPNYGCTESQYRDGDGCNKTTGVGYTCKECSEHPNAACGPGFFHAGACGKGTSWSTLSCDPCPARTFIGVTGHTQKSCVACGNVTCGEHQARVGTGCSPTTGEGYTCVGNPQERALCGPGHEPKPVVVDTTDDLTTAQPTCVECGSGSYKIGTSRDSCKRCSSCAAGTHVDCSSTSDAVCVTSTTTTRPAEPLLSLAMDVERFKAIGEQMAKLPNVSDAFKEAVAIIANPSMASWLSEIDRRRVFAVRLENATRDLKAAVLKGDVSFMDVSAMLEAMIIDSQLAISQFYMGGPEQGPPGYQCERSCFPGAPLERARSMDAAYEVRSALSLIADYKRDGACSGPTTADTCSAASDSDNTCGFEDTWYPRSPTPSCKLETEGARIDVKLYFLDMYMEDFEDMERRVGYAEASAPDAKVVADELVEILASGESPAESLELDLMFVAIRLEMIVDTRGMKGMATKYDEYVALPQAEGYDFAQGCRWHCPGLSPDPSAQTGGEMDASLALGIGGGVVAAVSLAAYGWSLRPQGAPMEAQQPLFLAA